MTEPGTSADQRAAEAVVQHHAQLADALNGHTARLLDAAERGDLPQVWRHRDDLTTWLHTELLPHAYAEEGALYPAAAAQPAGKLLVAGMIDEHRAIAGLLAELDAATSPVRAAAAARALAAAFATHLAKENNLVVPLLVQTADVSLAGLLAGMHELIGEHAEHSDASADGEGGCGCGGCGCGADAADGGEPEAVSTTDPRLDVRSVPHHQRHALVLAALDAVPAGGGLILIAPHAPRPLLAEIDAYFDGQFDVEWLQSGPDVWQIRLHRAPAAA